MAMHTGPHHPATDLTPDMPRISGGCRHERGSCEDLRFRTLKDHQKRASSSPTCRNAPHRHIGSEPENAGALEASGQDEAAAGLLRLIDLVKGSSLSEGDKRQVLDLLETLAEEAAKPEPKKGVLATLGKEIGVSLAASVIAEQAAPLLEQISQLWR
ncbi:hypothetical protein [Nonomuraea sp. NPDC049695]|uniref:hypothetical protein n=1 Tax=Nonomuraea sp. NPDC049695 TaxID=3154734 RepID=UPI00344559B3